jgi:hypothetical protein
MLPFIFLFIIHPPFSPSRRPCAPCVCVLILCVLLRFSSAPEACLTGVPPCCHCFPNSIATATRTAETSTGPDSFSFASGPAFDNAATMIDRRASVVQAAAGGQLTPDRKRQHYTATGLWACPMCYFTQVQCRCRRRPRCVASAASVEERRLQSCIAVLFLVPLSAVTVPVPAYTCLRTRACVHVPASVSACMRLRACACVPVPCARGRTCHSRCHTCVACRRSHGCRRVPCAAAATRSPTTAR